MTNNENLPKKGTKAYLQTRLGQVEKSLEYVIKQNTLLNSTLTRRAAMAHGLGKQFGGDRDLYTVLGYPTNPDYHDFYNLYDRDGIATRCVDVVSDETWRVHPVLVDKKGDTPDADNPSQLQQDFEELADKHDLWAKFNEMDAICGFSRFSLLFLGLPGKPDQPVTKSTELAYVTVHDEGDATINELQLVKNPEDPRFGLPEMYDISIDQSNIHQVPVHHTRVLHYKEGRQRSGGYGRIYGVPRLRNIINRFWDLEKVVGGASEAFWKLIYKGLALTAKEGMNLPEPGTDAYEAMVDEIDEYQHGLRRIMRLVGLDVTDLGSQPVSAKDQFDVIIAYIAGSERIPQRKLIGSAQGQLASAEEDDKDWMDFIDWRRRNQAEPYILRPFLAKMKDLGLLDVPDGYGVYWPELDLISDSEKMDVALKVAQAASTISGGAPETVYPAEEFTSKLPGEWKYVPTSQQIAEREEEKAEPDKANQEFDQTAFDEFVAKLPNNGGSAQARLNQLIENMAGAVNGTLLQGQRAAHLTCFVTDGSSDYSTMVAFIIPEVLRTELKAKYPFIQDDVLRDLHITLVYIGDIRTLNRNKIYATVSEWASLTKPLKIRMQGIARFVPQNGTKDPIVATFDSLNNELVDLRKSLTDMLRVAGIPYHDDHGYIPHMALAYIDSDASMPVDTLEPMEMNFSSVAVVIGDDIQEFDLGIPNEFVKYPIVQPTPEIGDGSGLDPYGDGKRFDPATVETHKKKK